MKKFLALFMSATLLLTGCLAGCDFSGSDVDDPEKPPVSTDDPVKQENAGNELIDHKDSVKYIFDELYVNKELQDTENGFEKSSDIKKARFFVNGNYKTNFLKESYKSSRDMKFELYNDTSVRFANVSAGYAFTLPTTEVSVDYTIAKYRVQFTFGDSILTSSFNTQNPYMANPNPWYPYGGEWLIRHLQNDTFMSRQNISRLNGTKAYNFTTTNSYGDLTFKPGYDVYRYDFLIENKGDIERPYYNIAVVRGAEDARNYALFVMKSKTDQAKVMDDLVMSYKMFRSKGTLKNYFKAGAPEVDPNWNQETKDYYTNLISSDKVHWGVFSYSMPGTDDSLHPGQTGYDSQLNNSKAMQKGIEEAWGHTYDIYPTYTHIGWGSGGNNIRYHYFPLDMANDLAGGNGKNGKPVLQFTYQFTTNNNIVADEVTPMFDILRGTYDNYFHQLAKDIKSYGKPVLFRLNNEMNTDWTSYSGMMTLLDPDVFNYTWQRLYNIFIAEGVDNCIWIWNPIATSCPYSNWGEDLCFFPGLDYVNLLGGTNYEMNNYAAGAADTSIVSFRERYSTLYDKNSETFNGWKMILSEFACGSGGDYSGELGRNRDAQAKWVKEMFDEFGADTMAEWAQTIKGCIWFNCNDVDGSKITNRLRFYDPYSTKYDDLGGTIKAFKDGFAKLTAKGR